MTDEEIVKDLTKLSLYTGLQEKHIQALNAALDLINRQKEEIETLKEFIVEISHCDKEIKSESVKQFTERLKEKISDCHIISDGEYCGFDCGDIHECIDNILKEMVGEE